MKEALGKIEILLIANLESFKKGLADAKNKLQEWSDKYSKKLKDLEEVSKKAGETLTKLVTIPLLGIGIAAVKAADKTGDFQKELGALRKQSMEALVPLGEAIIQTFRSIEPSIKSIVGAIRVLGEEFSELDPVIQRNVVLAAAGAAALGPVLIVVGTALGGIAGIIKGLVPVLTALSGTTKWVWGIAVPLASAAAALAGIVSTIWLAYAAGRYLYENFVDLQVALEKLRYGAESAFADIRKEFRVLVANMSLLASGIPDSVISALRQIPGGFGEMAAAIKATGVENAVSGLSNAYREYGEQLIKIEKVHQETMTQIQDGAGAGRSMGQILADDFQTIKSSVGSLLPDLDGLMGRVEKFAAYTPPVTEEINDKVKELSKTVKEDLGGAIEETFDQKLERRIEGFADSVGDAFAGLALEGENSFMQLAKSFERMLVSMAATQFLFQPIFDSIGGFVGRQFRAPSTSGTADPGFIGPMPGQGYSAKSLAHGGGGVVVNVFDQRTSGGGSIDVQQRGGSIDIVVRDSVRKLIRSGDLDKDMKLAYGTSRAGRL